MLDGVPATLCDTFKLGGDTMISKQWLWCVLAAALVVGLGGCRETEKPSAASTGAAEPALPTPASGPEIPTNFPTDVPQYPGGEVLLTRDGGDKSVSLRFQTDDPVPQVAGFYARLLTAEGWSTENRPSIGGAAVFANKGKRRAAVSVSTTKAGKTQVDVMIAKSPF